MAEKNYEYFLKSDLSNYAGEWVVILENAVVAHGGNFKEVAEMVDKEHSGKKALITRIPAKIAQLI